MEDFVETTALAVEVRDWNDLVKKVRRDRRDIYEAILPFVRYCRAKSIEPHEVSDGVLDLCTAEMIANGGRAPETHRRRIAGAWSQFTGKMNFVLPPLSPVATSRSEAAARWASLPQAMRDDLADFVGPCGPSDKPTRERTNLRIAAEILHDAMLPVLVMSDLLTQPALDASADGFPTNAKRKSVLEVLSALARGRGDDAAHERCRSIIKATVSEYCTLESESGLAVDHAIVAERRERLLTTLTDAVLVFCALPFRGRIAPQQHEGCEDAVGRAGRRDLTRKNLMPRAQDAMAAIIVLETRIRLTALGRRRFAVVAGGVRFQDPDLARADLSGVPMGPGAAALLKRLHAAMVVHCVAPPKSLFDKIKNAGPDAVARSTGSVGKNIALLTAEAGVPLDVRQLVALSERHVAVQSAKPDRSDAAVGAGRRYLAKYNAKHGPDLDASLTQRFADAELSGIPGAPASNAAEPA